MKTILGLLSMFIYATASSQTPKDTLFAKDSAILIFPDATKPGAKKQTSVVLVSEGPVTVRDSSSWDNRWQNHIDLESVKIAEKLLLRDSTKIVYKVMLDFYINEDGSLKDLKISCFPRNELIEQECYKMVMKAPKKSPQYRNGKYVRPHIQQPIEIKIKGSVE